MERAMDLKLKPISKNGIVEALSKVTHYRYLNQFDEAESICRDVIAADPEHQRARRMLGLVLTDQFTGKPTDNYAEAEALFDGLSDAYERQYYSGILHERRAKAQLAAGHLPHTVAGHFEEAMRSYEQAEKIRPAGNDDAILRWNRCARLLHGIESASGEKEEGIFEAGDSAPY
jgi:tetratricopeptide (TPR) repeat protein